MCSERNQETFAGADESTVLLGGAVKCLSAHAILLEFCGDVAWSGFDGMTEWLRRCFVNKLFHFTGVFLPIRSTFLGDDHTTQLERQWANAAACAAHKSKLSIVCWHSCYWWHLKPRPAWTSSWREPDVHMTCALVKCGTRWCLACMCCTCVYTSVYIASCNIRCVRVLKLIVMKVCSACVCCALGKWR